MGLLKTKRIHRILKGGKKKVTHKPKATQLRNPERSKVRGTKRATTTGKKTRPGLDRKNLQNKRTKSTKDVKKDEHSKKRNKKEEEDEGLEDYEVEATEAHGSYYFPTEQVRLFLINN